MFDEIVNNCDGNCCLELYVCPFYYECLELQKIAKAVGIGEIPMNWDCDEISLAKEHYGCI